LRAAHGEAIEERTVDKALPRDDKNEVVGEGEKKTSTLTATQQWADKKKKDERRSRWPQHHITTCVWRSQSSRISKQRMAKG